MATSSAEIEQQSGRYGDIPFLNENLLQECLKTIFNCNSGSVSKENYFWQKKDEDGNGLPVIKRGRMAWGIKNYLLSYQVEEDASTMDAHRE